MGEFAIYHFVGSSLLGRFNARGSESHLGARFLSTRLRTVLLCVTLNTDKAIFSHFTGFGIKCGHSKGVAIIGETNFANGKLSGCNRKSQTETFLYQHVTKRHNPFTRIKAAIPN